MCEKDEKRIGFIKEHYPQVLTVSPEECKKFTLANSEQEEQMWFLRLRSGSYISSGMGMRKTKCNCDCGSTLCKAQILPLPDMYGKNLTFKTGGVDGCHCEETLKLIAEGRLDTEPLLTHTYPLCRIEEAYELFENKRDGVIKVAVEC